jgi:Tfp pilus assembly protein FimT
MNTAVFRNIFIDYTSTTHNTMRGLTIVEMIASLAVICFVLVVAIPAFIAQLSCDDIDRSAKEISSAFTMARLRAIESRTPHRVKFDLNSTPQKFTVQRGVTSLGFTTWINDVTIQEMQEDILINNINGVEGKKKCSGIGSIEFNTVGKPTTGAVYLKDKKGEKYTIALNGATGRVTKTRGWQKI